MSVPTHVACSLASVLSDIALLFLSILATLDTSTTGQVTATIEKGKKTTAQETFGNNDGVKGTAHAPGVMDPPPPSVSAAKDTTKKTPTTSEISIKRSRDSTSKESIVDVPMMKRSRKSDTLLKDLLQHGSKMLQLAASKVEQFAPATVSSDALSKWRNLSSE